MATNHGTRQARGHRIRVLEDTIREIMGEVTRLRLEGKRTTSIYFFCNIDMTIEEEEGNELVPEERRCIYTRRNTNLPCGRISVSATDLCEHHTGTRCGSLRTNSGIPCENNHTTCIYRHNGKHY